MITCHDHQLVEIVIGGSRGNSPAVREGLQVREAILGIHAAVWVQGSQRAPRYV